MAPTVRKSPPRPRPFRRVRIALAALALAAAGTYGYAWLHLDTSTFSRALIWMDADVDDWKRFPARTIPAGHTAFNYEKGPGYPDGLPADAAPGHPDLAAMLAANQTTAFIVVKDGRLIYERYFNGRTHDSVETSFSMAKSFNSAMAGRAMADGLLGLDDPVTRYLPELLRRDVRFTRITIGHLLSMSSGLRYSETGTPWGDDANTYYNPDLRRLGLEATEILGPPGREFHYNNFNPMLVGMVLERITRKSVSAYLAETIWQPLGAEANATWSLDSQQSGFEKMESGINARAIDFIKLGSLYLNRGNWRGVQVLPASWVDESTRYSKGADPTMRYQYGWWTFNRPELGDFYAAIGNKGQYIFVFPSKGLVILRQGIDRGGVEWHNVIPAIATRVGG